MCRKHLYKNGVTALYIAGVVKKYHAGLITRSRRANRTHRNHWISEADKALAGETDWWDASGLFLYMFCTRNLGSILVRREVDSSPQNTDFKKYLIFIKKYNIIYIEKLRKNKYIARWWNGRHTELWPRILLVRV